MMLTENPNILANPNKDPVRPRKASGSPIRSNEGVELQTLR